VPAELERAGAEGNVVVDGQAGSCEGESAAADEESSETRSPLRYINRNGRPRELPRLDLRWVLVPVRCTK